MEKSRDTAIVGGKPGRSKKKGTPETGERTAGVPFVGWVPGLRKLPRGSKETRVSKMLPLPTSP